MGVMVNTGKHLESHGKHSQACLYGGFSAGLREVRLDSQETLWARVLKVWSVWTLLAGVLYLREGEGQLPPGVTSCLLPLLL